MLEVRQPRLPCFKLGLRHADRLLPRGFAHAGRPDAYLAIVEPGEVAAGDRVELLERPNHEVTVALVSHVFLRDRRRASELLAAPTLPAQWLAWAHELAHP